MKNPLTRVLLKVVARGFYQEHTGWLISLFLVVFVNFFWTRVPSQNHLTEAQILENGFRLVLLSVSEPIGVAALLGVCFVYSLKSWNYVAGRLKSVDVQFLAYSSNALPWRQQVTSWAVVQGVILLPVVVLCLYAMVIGVIFHHWLVPLLLPVYLLLLTVTGAAYYTRLLNDTVVKPDKRAGLTWARNWPKPVFSLFLYEIIATKRVTYFITKGASAASIALLLLAFSDSRTDVRLAGMIALCCAVGHVILIFQASEFELFYLPFVRNLPYGRGQAYGQQVLLYGVLLLPELVWLLAAGGFRTGLTAAGLLLSVTLLLRTLLYWTGQHMTSYLRIVVGLFLFLLLANLFALTGLLALGSALAAGLLLYRYR
ncbi:hypothetical protein [Hymenobacter lapidiphilus]|uniref:Uncharacterized protein n=1 Tax=Hymenobacter lapidiphilus TaxID=2608003 RepID=A0A7Y7U7G5_9BACT|nr:hypothetical protein [Hymenobacter lapidiphilus]NVO33402.1 hypothetical protein [Hymenobacter lapidiphilus]